MKILANLDLTKNQLLNAKFQLLATDPGTPEEGQFWYNSTEKTFNYYDGAVVQAITAGSLEGILGTAPIVVTDNDGVMTISINAATDAAAGSMSATDKAKLDAATALNNASTLVFRDASGDFAANIITAALTGTASNAALLDNNNAAHYLNRDNHSGTQLASTVSDFDTQVHLSRLDQMAAPTGNVTFNDQKITNLGTPSQDADAATKAYVDAAAQGLTVKDAVRVATTANITLSGLQTVDGVELAVGDRALVKLQTTASENGIYQVSETAWTRPSDANTSEKMPSGTFVFVTEGTTYDNSGWVLGTNDPIVLGDTALEFVQFSGAGQITAGTGMSKDGNTLNVGGTADRIVVTADAVDIDAAYVGQASITTLGTVTNGAWEGTDVAVEHGGTGASDAATARTNLGAVGKYAVAVGDGSATNYVVTHDMGTRDVQVSIYLNTGTYEQVMADVEHTNDNTVTIRFAVAPTSNQYRVVVVG